MRKVLLGVLCLAVSSTVFAQRVPAGRTWAQPTVVEGMPLDATALFHQYATMPRAAVATEGPDDAFLFAVAGSTPAAGGTYFHSEVTLVNNKPNSSQYVLAIYFPSDNTLGCNNYVAKVLNLAANSFYTYRDFVDNPLSTRGLGSLVFIGVTSSGSVDSTANIDGFSRIWTPVPGSAGTASQSFPSVAISGYPGVQYIYGLHTESGFRSNVFIFNYNPNVTTARRFTLNIFGDNGASGAATVDVQPCALGLYSIAGNYAGTGVAVTPPDSQAGWFAFGSTVDQASSDNWSVAGRPDGIH